MKKALRVIGLMTLVCVVTFAVSCSSDDDDPADNDFFADTYKGDFTYKKGDTNKVEREDSKVLVTKLGDGEKYRFDFHSTEIPEFTAQFEEKGDHILLNVDFENGVQYIKIDENHLTMRYSDGDETWTGDAKR